MTRFARRLAATFATLTALHYAGIGLGRGRAPFFVGQTLPSNSRPNSRVPARQGCGSGYRRMGAASRTRPRSAARSMTPPANPRPYRGWCDDAGRSGRPGPGGAAPTRTEYEPRSGRRASETYKAATSYESSMAAATVQDFLLAHLAEGRAGAMRNRRNAGPITRRTWRRPARSRPSWKLGIWGAFRRDGSHRCI